MRTFTAASLTAVATVAFAVPVSTLTLRGLDGPLSARALGASSHEQPAPEAAVNVPMGHTTLATPAQSRGVVLIDTALPQGVAAGTGMVMRADGIILTNYHVVSGSDRIRVTLPKGKTYSASVIGHDAQHDVAVLKVAGASGLDVPQVDDDGVRVAERVLAIGQGKGRGVLYAATGSVTAKDRSITATEQGSLTAQERLTGLIQTNAPIVGGYSGGPLFDAAGKVVGIDTAAAATNSMEAVASRASSAEGYAIPIMQAHAIATDIIAGKKTGTNHIGKRSALGIAVLPSSPTTSQDPGAIEHGVVVRQLPSDSPAGAAGMTAGSTITRVGGDDIVSTTDLMHALDSHYPGDRVMVSWRDAAGASHTASVRLQEATTN